KEATTSGQDRFRISRKVVAIVDDEQLAPGVGLVLIAGESNGKEARPVSGRQDDRDERPLVTLLATHCLPPAPPGSLISLSPIERYANLCLIQRDRRRIDADPKLRQADRS